METHVDRKFVLTASGYGLLGLALGIYMAASHDHGQRVTHAHIMLIGFAVSFFYAAAHRLWLSTDGERLARIQFYAHQIGTAGVVLGLYLLYGGHVPMERIEPLLAGSSVVVLIAFAMMKWQLIRARPERA